MTSVGSAVAWDSENSPPAETRCYPLSGINPVATSSSGSPTWMVRGETLMVSYTELAGGDSLIRDDQVDEYMILLPYSSSRVEVSTPAGPAVPIMGPALVIVPPGKSACIADGEAAVVRIFSTADAELADRASNAGEFRSIPAPSPAPWPDPPDGFRIRVYPIEAPPEQSGPHSGSIYQSTNLMVNWIKPRIGKRDRRQLSPHLHSGYAQASLVVSGEYIHHVRVPWTSDATRWRSDVHARSRAPSVIFMPEGVVHGSEWVGEGENRVIDIYTPPRLDLLHKQGLVRNAAEYPPPDSRQVSA